VFSTKVSDKLPPHSSFDHHINLQSGTKPPLGLLYPCSESELKTQREFLNKVLASGQITRSNFPTTAPILFVTNLNGKLRIFLDYSGLNKMQIKDKYPLPLRSEVRDRLRTAKVFTMLDLKDGFHLIKIAQGVE
jgi:hypothetical protein